VLIGLPTVSCIAFAQTGHELLQPTGIVVTNDHTARDINVVPALFAAGTSDVTASGNQRSKLRFLLNSPRICRSSKTRNAFITWSARSTTTALVRNNGTRLCDLLAIQLIAATEHAHALDDGIFAIQIPWRPQSRLPSI
jgi:hypothetical protein